jgi:hypothetical protein
LLFSALAWLLFGPVIPFRDLHSLYGASRDDVAEALGHPTAIQNDSEWIYTRWPNQGYVGVTFDQSGRVIVVNDESVFP